MEIGWNLIDKKCPDCDRNSLILALMTDYSDKFFLKTISIYCGSGHCDYNLEIAKKYNCKECKFFENFETDHNFYDFRRIRCLNIEIDEDIFLDYFSDGNGCIQWELKEDL